MYYSPYFLVEHIDNVSIFT